ncbi:preprotein translocase subunit SecG [Blattabacterium cuenoti]|uniref:preprotein translocase subunit SecG n=1 Tax=Blattabacterium cuenoti TaxID=1653831 RepID=UPI00163CB2DA|nr:preprotein translocase subunit SecG [Blattabacterium cuenoti]
MPLITTILGFIIIITCFFFILIVLIQTPKKESINQNFIEKDFKFLGVKKTNIFIENITWFLSVTIFFLTLLFNYFLK